MRPVRRTEDLVVQELDGEILVYDLKIDKAFCLNTTSAKVWSLCDGNRDIVQITKELGRGKNADSAEELVLLALHQLADQDLIDLPAEIYEPSFITRRRLIEVAGKTAVIALPLVSTLMVPSAAMAQSAATCSGNFGQPCNCIGKVRNFNIPCDSTGCSVDCACQPPFTGCNGGGHFCQGTCG